MIKPLLFLSVALAAWPVALQAKEPDICPTPTAAELEIDKKQKLSNKKSREKVTALVGVDALGRLLMAVDHDGNESADELMLFTPQERLKGPWSRLVRHAKYQTTNGTVSLEARDRSLAIAIAVGPAEPPALTGGGRPFKQVVKAVGLELVKYNIDPNSPQLLNSFDITVPESWPPHFAEDMVRPETTAGYSQCYNCQHTRCQEGGCFAQSAAIECDGLIDSAGSVSCHSASFACCNCTNGPFFPITQCRCVGCRRYPVSSD